MRGGRYLAAVNTLSPNASVPRLARSERFIFGRSFNLRRRSRAEIEEAVRPAIVARSLIAFHHASFLLHQGMKSSTRIVYCDDLQQLQVLRFNYVLRHDSMKRRRLLC